MHLSPSLVPFATTFTSSVLADDVPALGSPQTTITFCNEPHYAGDRIQQYVNWGVCYPVPDSNAKGDKGSSWYTTNWNSQCKLWTDENCTGHASMWNMKMDPIRNNIPYRSFKCRDASEDKWNSNT